MAYRVRSRYTPGGGVLAFFEQVSRFVSLSVALWIGVSLFLILFFSDGKVTDSFDLHLLSGIFTNGQIFLTSVILISCSGVLGAIISIPASIVLLLTRQYLDFHLSRSSRRHSFFRMHVVKNIPLFVLVSSHFLLFFLNLASAPQLTRSWFREGSKVSELLTGSHFALASLTRRQAIENRVNAKAMNSERDSIQASDAKRVQLIFVPAAQMETDEFLSEVTKIPGAIKIPFIMPRSSVIDQMDFLLRDISGITAQIARKTIHKSSDYSRIISKDRSQTMVSASPQIRFGNQLAGLGTDSMINLNDHLLYLEAQRRIILSQVQLFGFFRLVNGVPFINSSFTWLNLVADDVSRLRSAAIMDSRMDPKLNSISIIQLSGLETEFKNVKTPFRPLGWMLQDKSYEFKIVNKNIARELLQFVFDVGGRDLSNWIILPYADDNRDHPKSFAIIPSRLQILKDGQPSADFGPGFLSGDIARGLSHYLSESNSATIFPSGIPDVSLVGVTGTNKNEEPKLLFCSETEVDFVDPEFKFQSIELREKSLGQILNSLPLMPESDLAFLGKSLSSLVSRELGLGFLCQIKNQLSRETYLLKYRDTNAWNAALKGTRIKSSIFLNKSSENVAEASNNSKSKLIAAGVVHQSLKETMRPDVLREFVVLQLDHVGGQGDTEVSWNWRRLDESESDDFFAKFRFDTLHAIELSARARIR